MFLSFNILYFCVFNTFSEFLRIFYCYLFLLFSCFFFNFIYILCTLGIFLLSSFKIFKQLLLLFGFINFSLIFRILSFKVLQRIDDVSLMCDKRIASLKKLALKPPRPIQTVTPEPAVPLQPPGGAPHLLRRKHKVS